MENNIKDIALIQQEVGVQLQDKEVMKALVTTTFKGLQEASVKQAIVEGMMRGFTFKDFLEKNIYAIPFSSGYSLVTSIDYARKIGMRSGVIGKSAPIFEEKDGKVVSCSVTIQKEMNGTIGNFTETVYFSEYTTGKNLWNTKPRTMIAKVAEMHALRMACPEELSQAYVEEELEKEVKVKPELNLAAYAQKLEATTTLEDLKKVWASLPAEAKTELEYLKENLKSKYN